MDFDFDTQIPLRDTNSTKWDNMESRLGLTGPDVIPMWVADMDFKTAPSVLAALQAEVDKGVPGYFGQSETVDNAVAGWWSRRFGWDVDPSWMTYTSGVVAGVGATVEAFSEKGDRVIVFSPVYHAFYRRVRDLEREILESELRVVDGRHEMDLEALEAALTGREKILILCSPHNPGGRLWSKAELQSVASFCKTHDLILLSDEIHMDLTFPGSTHLPTAIAAPECLDRLVVVSSASKTFNTGGAETGYAIVPDAHLRRRYRAGAAAAGGSPNRFGLQMIRGAYDGGEAWLEAVRTYLAENFRIWRARIDAIPGLAVMDMSATYLTWVDFRGTGMDGTEIKKRLHDDARIGMSPGPQFGTGGEGWHRFNIAMPRPLMMEAIERIEAAFSDLQ